MEFQNRVDLAAERLGGKVLVTNDDFFAPKENLLKPGRGVFIEDKFTERGKWMDGWESRRRREPGHDWCIIELGLPGIIHGIDVDTNHFRGNYPEHASLEACETDGDPTADGVNWVEIVSQSPLEGHTQNLFEVEDDRRWTHVRFHIYPDGGVARLRVYGKVLPDKAKWGNDLVDLAAVENGGEVVTCNDMFFGSRHNLVMPGDSINMGDGWETRRRRDPGNDWVTVKLGARGSLKKMVIDTSHFKGNFPDRFSLEGIDRAGASVVELCESSCPWVSIYPEMKLEAHKKHEFELDTPEITHVRLSIYPDGGVARLRLFGAVSKEDDLLAKIQWLNDLPQEEAKASFLRCCGSTRWAERMTGLRPFPTLNAMTDISDNLWKSLTAEDWMEAFQAHPRIGDRKSGGAWEKREQSGVASATDDLLKQFEEGNRKYEEKFKRVFLVCATGKSAEEMFAELGKRMENSREDELEIALEEQRKIIRLRLEKLITS